MQSLHKAHAAAVVACSCGTKGKARDKGACRAVSGRRNITESGWGCMQHLWDVALKQVRLPSAALAITAHLTASLPTTRHLVASQRPQLLPLAYLQQCAPSHDRVSSPSSAGASPKAPSLRERACRLHGRARSRQGVHKARQHRASIHSRGVHGWVRTPGCSALQSVAGAVSDLVPEALAQCAQASYRRARCMWLCPQHQELSCAPFVCRLWCVTS